MKDSKNSKEPTAMKKRLIAKTTNNKKEFGFPPRAELEKVVKRFADPKYRRVNQGLKPNASTEDKIKYNLCVSISNYQEETDTPEKELVKKLGINQIKTEYILFCHIDKLNLDELVNNTEKLAMPLEVKINSKYAWEKTSAKAH